MASSRLSGIPELLDLLGRQINAQGLLYRLCLVSRAFKAAFIPHLFKCLRWDNHNIAFLVDKEKQQLLLDSGNLVHTQVFIILHTAISCHLKTWETGHPQHQKHWNDWYYPGQEIVYTEICDAVTKLLPNLEKIQSFISQDIAISSECMTALSKIDTLCIVSIAFPRDNDAFIGLELDGQVLDTENEQRMASFGNIELDFKFSGLRKLSLQNLWGDVKSWRQEIFQVILNSPELEHISLSIAKDTAERLDMVETEEDEEDWRFYIDLFQWLCHKYTAELGTPLKLKSVQLGYGIRFHDLASMENDFDPSILEKAHIHNHYSDPPIYTMPWDLLLAANSPKLRYISLSEVNEECRAMSQRDLAINMPIGYRLGSYNLDDSDNSISSLYDLFADNEGSQPSMLILPPMPFDMDDDLSPFRNNSWITAFAFELRISREELNSLSMFDQSISTILEILATFSSLKYIWITIPNTGASIPVPVVERFDTVCSSLCYIRINTEAWRIHRYEDSTGDILESLTEWEDEVEGLDFFQWGVKINLIE